MKTINVMKSFLLSTALLLTASCVVDEQGKEILDEQVISNSINSEGLRVEDLEETKKKGKNKIKDVHKVYETECWKKRKATISFLKNGDIVGIHEFFSDETCEGKPHLRDEYFYKAMKKGHSYTAVIYEAYKHPMYMSGDQYRERTFVWSCTDKSSGCYEDAVVENGVRTPIHQSGYFAFGAFGKMAKFEFRPIGKGEYKVVVDKDYFSWFWLFDYDSGGLPFRKVK